MNYSDGTNPLQPPRRFPPTPRPYHLSDPFLDRGLWCFWLSADAEVLEYVSNMSCILHPPSGSLFQRRLIGRVLFAINPRYDHQEAWTWVKDTLDAETHFIELDDSWESAITEAQEHTEDS